MTDRGPGGPRQVIPRPPDARPGEGAPWAVLADDEKRHITMARVRKAVTGRGHALGWAERTALGGFPDPGAPAAVLVPLFEEHSEARVLLTRRAAHLKSHTGEVSFPGGKLNPRESPEDAALREAFEEVGLEPAGVEILGRLSTLSTYSSRTEITPVVGAFERRPSLLVNPSEVEHAFDVELCDLASDGVFREERWSMPGRGSFPVWFFELPDDIIWGATARVLVELLRLVLEV